VWVPASGDPVVDAAARSLTRESVFRPVKGYSTSKNVVQESGDPKGVPGLRVNPYLLTGTALRAA